MDRDRNGDYWVWVAIATYAPEDDVDPICVVAITPRAAEKQLEVLITKQDTPDMWIALDPVQKKVLK